jgi:hypothetical protein
MIHVTDIFGALVEYDNDHVAASKLNAEYVAQAIKIDLAAGTALDVTASLLSRIEDYDMMDREDTSHPHLVATH